MYQFTKRCILLRRTANDGEGPNGIFPMMDSFDFHPGEIMLFGVIPQVVSERPFGFGRRRIYRPHDHKISVCVDGCVVVRNDHRNAMAGQRTRKSQFA